MPERKVIFLKLLFFSLFFFSLTFAQNNSIVYTTGYIIFSNHDIIFGKLGIISDEESCQKIEFLDSTGNKLNNINAETVKEYKRGNDLFFSKEVKRPNWLGKRKFFMKLIESGKVNLYKFSFERNSPGGFIDYGNGNKGYYQGNSENTY